MDFKNKGAEGFPERIEKQRPDYQKKLPNTLFQVQGGLLQEQEALKALPERAQPGGRKAAAKTGTATVSFRQNFAKQY